MIVNSRIKPIERNGYVEIFNGNEFIEPDAGTAIDMFCAGKNSGMDSTYKSFRGYAQGSIFCSGFTEPFSFQSQQIRINGLYFHRVSTFLILLFDWVDSVIMDYQAKIYPETIHYTPSFENMLETLPHSPGVFVFRDAEGIPLYVGKSTKLRKRVQHYFRASSRDRKSRHLRALTKRIDFFCLQSDFQAKEVESDLIRSYRPEYNTLYLDYIRRPMIRISTDPPYPSVRVVSDKTADDTAQYFGPYHSNRRIRQILSVLGEIFMFRTCDYQIPEDGDPDHLELCHQHFLGRCEGPCIGKDSPTDYQRRIGLLKSFLRGEQRTVIDDLEEKMQEHAEKREYEAAALVRDQLKSLKQMKQYEPFIRKTQEADIIYRDRQQSYSMIQIREHRVHEFCIDSPIETLPDSPRKKITNRPSRVDGVSPQYPEEKNLLQALEKTTEHRRKQSPKWGRIRDRINFHNRTIRRTLGNEKTVEFQLCGTENTQEEWIAKHYSVHANRGIPLPDTVIGASGGDFELPIKRIKEMLEIKKTGIQRQ